jgi:hypothetical protein
MNPCASLAQLLQCLKLMNVALVTSHGRMAPCFGGVELQIVDDNAELREARVLSTHDWHPLAWGRELMRRDVTLLMCAGVDQATWAALRGHGIQVIPNAIGDPATVFATWRSGRLSPPQLWPAYPVGFGGRRGFGGGRRRRFHGGRR